MKVLNTVRIATVLMLLPIVASAAPSGKGVPWALITYQAINILILVGGLIFFLRRPVSEFFAQRRVVYKEAAEKAMQARLAAEAINREIKERLERLEKTEQQTLERSKVEAQALETKIVQEGRDMASRLNADVQRMVRTELDKAKATLRNEIIDNAFVAAEAALKTKMNESEQKRLQGEFVNKIQVART